MKVYQPCVRDFECDDFGPIFATEELSDAWIEINHPTSYFINTHGVKMPYDSGWETEEVIVHEVLP